MYGSAMAVTSSRPRGPTPDSLRAHKRSPLVLNHALCGVSRGVAALRLCCDHGGYLNSGSPDPLVASWRMSTPYGGTGMRCYDSAQEGRTVPEIRGCTNLGAGVGARYLVQTI